MNHDRGTAPVLYPTVLVKQRCCTELREGGSENALKAGGAPVTHASISICHFSPIPCSGGELLAFVYDIFP